MGTVTISGFRSGWSRHRASIIALLLLTQSFAGGAEDRALPERFSLLCWNIHKESAALERLAVFKEIPDLLCLQEWRSELPQKPFLGYYGNFSEAWTRPDGGFSGVATFATAAPADEPEMLITRWREGYFFTRKSSLVTEYRLEGSSENLLVVNTHALQFQPGPNGLRSQMEAITKRIREHAGPVIACGDYNTWRRDRLRVVREALTAGGGEEIDFPEGRTAALPIVFLALGNTRTPLDRVFVRGLKIVGESEVLDLGASDHRALRVTLERSRPGG